MVMMIHAQIVRGEHPSYLPSCPPHSPCPTSSASLPARRRTGNITCANSVGTNVRIVGVSQKSHVVHALQGGYFGARNVYYFVGPELFRRCWTHPESVGMSSRGSAVVESDLGESVRTEFGGVLISVGRQPVRLVPASGAPPVHHESLLASQNRSFAVRAPST